MVLSSLVKGCTESWSSNCNTRNTTTGKQAKLTLKASCCERFALYRQEFGGVSRTNNEIACVRKCDLSI